MSEFFVATTPLLDVSKGELRNAYVIKLYDMKDALGVSSRPIGKGDVFDIPAYYSPNSCRSESWPKFTKRPLPSFATTSSRFRVELTTKIIPWNREIKLHVLSTETWRGLWSRSDSLPIMDQVRTSGLDVPSMGVVVKFLQLSLLWVPLTDGATNADYQARKEAVAYDYLNPLQGSVIPYFFQVGKHIVGDSKILISPRLLIVFFRLLLQVAS